MPVMYLEDVLEKGVNKYLVVNIAAQRGRHINEKGIPMLMDNAQKPVTLALEELNEGKPSKTTRSPLCLMFIRKHISEMRQLRYSNFSMTTVTRLK